MNDHATRQTKPDAEPPTRRPSTAGGSERQPFAADTYGVCAQRPSVELGPDGIPGIARSVSRQRQQSILALQRTVGNAAVQRLLAHDPMRATRKASVSAPGVQRQPKPDDGPTLIEGGKITGSATGKAPTYDPETTHELKMQALATLLRTKAEARLAQCFSKTLSAVKEFKTSADGQIDKMEGEPGDLWGLVPTLLALAGDGLKMAHPGAALAVAISGKVVSLGEYAAKDGAKTAKLKPKTSAKAALEIMVKKMESTQENILNGVNKSLEKRVFLLVVGDDEARAMLETGVDKNLDLLCERLGVPDPTKKSPYGYVLESLEVQFGGWMAKETFLNQHADTLFKKMMIEADKDSPLHKQMQWAIDDAKKEARNRARAKAKERGEPGYEASK